MFCDIACLNYIDRDGFSATIRAPDRLANYANTDFLCPQPFQKVMCVYKPGKDGCIPSFVASYYDNGQIKQHLEVLDGRAYGRYREWHENGVLRLEVPVVGGMADISPEGEKSWIFEGMANVWGECGNIIAEINYCNGRLEGESLYYFSSGGLQRRISFHNNLIEGLEEVFNGDGSLLEEIEYVKGERSGRAVRYWAADLLAAEEYWNHDQLVEGVYRDVDGDYVGEITDGNGWRALFDQSYTRALQEYTEGRPDGQVRVFDETGQLSSTYYLKNNQKHGEEIVYYPGSMQQKRSGQIDASPQPQLLMTWHEDMVHGITKTWYPNGIQESQRELADNQKNGIATAWYRDGSLMLMEEYLNDRLVRGQYFKRGQRTAECTVVDGCGVASLYDADGKLLKRVTYFHGRPLD